MLGRPLRSSTPVKGTTGLWLHKDNVIWRAHGLRRRCAHENPPTRTNTYTITDKHKAMIFSSTENDLKAREGRTEPLCKSRSNPCCSKESQLFQPFLKLSTHGPWLPRASNQRDGDKPHFSLLLQRFQLKRALRWKITFSYRPRTRRRSPAVSRLLPLPENVLVEHGSQAGPWTHTHDADARICKC